MNQVSGTHILHLTADNFRAEVIDKATPMLIDFWAPWCGPCKMMKPILAEAAAQLDGKVRVAEINVDEEPAISETFGISSIPTCVLVKGGKVVDVIVGVQPAKNLVDRVMRQV